MFALISRIPKIQTSEPSNDFGVFEIRELMEPINGSWTRSFYGARS